MGGGLLTCSLDFQVFGLLARQCWFLMDQFTFRVFDLSMVAR